MQWEDFKKTMKNTTQNTVLLNEENMKIMRELHTLRYRSKKPNYDKTDVLRDYIKGYGIQISYVDNSELVVGSDKRYQLVISSHDVVII